MSEYREELFDTAQVVIAVEGDLERCWLTVSDPAWAPFVEVVTALLALKPSQCPEDLTALRLTGVEIRVPEEGASDALQAFWNEELGRDRNDPPLRYLEFVRPGTDDGALMPEHAARSWARIAPRMWGQWQRKERIRLGWIERCRAAEATALAEPRTVDWSIQPLSEQDRARLAALEERARGFDDMIPDAEVTHIVRDRVLLALAAAGVLDGPDEGLRARTLGALGHRTLLAWREAALTLLAWAANIPEMMAEGCAHALSSPVSLDWFRCGPYAGALVAPMEWLRFHMPHFMDEVRSAPGGLELFSHDYGARHVWRTGIADLQQLAQAGQPVTNLPWQGQATHVAALCTRANHPAVGAVLGAILVDQTPDDWHGWTELGVALARLVPPSSTHPYRLSRSRPLDRPSMAGAAHACLARAVEKHPPLRGASFLEEIASDLAGRGLWGEPSPVPLAQLARTLLANVDGDALAVCVSALPAHLRRQALTLAALYAPAVRDAVRPLLASALTSTIDDPLRRWILVRLAACGGRDAELHALLDDLPGAHTLEPFLSDARAALI